MEKEQELNVYGQVCGKKEIKSEVENAFIPYFSIFFNLFSFLKKENRILASTTNLILGFRPHLTRPYLLAKSSFTALPNLKQSSSDSLLFSVIYITDNNVGSEYINNFSCIWM